MVPPAALGSGGIKNKLVLDSFYPLPISFAFVFFSEEIWLFVKPMPRGAGSESGGLLSRVYRAFGEDDEREARRDGGRWCNRYICWKIHL